MDRKFPCNANVTINCLLNAFMMWPSLPEVLYLQGDNAAKDNKNVILIGFLTSLVERKIFKKVKLSFLMVGHTHEDVDQMFSNISRRLKYNSAPSLKGLHQEVKTLTHQCQLEKLSGHQTPHLFVITESAGRVILHYKDWPLRSVNYQDLDITNLAKSVISRPPVVNAIDIRFLAEFDAMS
ncbi:hypothetical protein KUTeg_012088 [Tegillarca granosa]|uniref:DUF7869 domain-containing protein n=1 Tax=Tegillarca granosa TaxID=220873 RepID=A0ABQ9EYJ0_TEGGR|nr:hypothetical protein KUTeg_012088 [Tegillarca granosa]